MPPSELLLIPNLKKRFSGITSTTLQVLPEIAREMEVRVVGYPLPDGDNPLLTWGELWRRTAPRAGGCLPVFHARRNVDMVLGLLLRHLGRRRMHLIFTSVAQRHHTRFTRFLYRRMDTLLSTSERSASYLRRAPDAIIPHGTDVRLYHPPGNRAEAWAAGGLPGRRGIGIFGRVRPQKGHHEFVKALCRVLPAHPDFTAVIVGETTPKFQPFELQLREMARRAGLEKRIVWLGKLPYPEIPLWFRRMSLVAAVPHNEGFGLTCLEAMASGCPVVATRTGGFEMVIREGIDGTLVPCGDTDALAEALERLLTSPDQLDRMGTEARKRILADFTAEREAAALLQIYRRAGQSAISARNHET